MPTEGPLSMPLGEAIYSLRAIRRLKPDPIPDEDLKDILEATIRAPNGGNQQPWHFIVVQDPRQRQALGKSSFFFNDSSFSIKSFSSPCLKFPAQSLLKKL